MRGIAPAAIRYPIVYVNQVGGDDDLIFDGRSCAFDAKGRLIARGKPFTEDVVMVDPRIRQRYGSRG